VEGALREGAAAPGLRLIETMAWDGRAAPRLAGHLARLTASAARLGWPCDRAAVAAAIGAAAPGQPARLRLTLDARGTVAIETGPLPPPPAAPWRLTLAATRLAAADPWLRLKSTRRAAYDAARAALPADRDEAVFQNERGEVCDGSITSLFFDRGAGMRTPPLSAGLLPGVLRAELLAAGTCAEETLPTTDLPRLRLWVGNAVRGLIPAVWAG
jgi:4-amino-4-deoxychorismate lyase